MTLRVKEKIKFNAYFVIILTLNECLEVALIKLIATLLMLGKLPTMKFLKITAFSLGKIMTSDCNALVQLYFTC